MDENLHKLLSLAHSPLRDFTTSFINRKTLANPISLSKDNVPGIAFLVIIKKQPEKAISGTL